MLQLLQSIDQFGVQQNLQIPPTNPTQKSVFGGLVTLTLYGISLGYFIYQFVDWRQNNKLPKVTTLQEQVNENQTLKLQGVFAEISYFTELSHQIDPFDPQNIILQPKLISTTNYFDKKIINTTFQSSKTQEGKTINKIIIEDIVISVSPISSKELKYMNYQLSFGYCNPKYLQDGQHCANQDLINQFLLQDNYFQMLIYLDQFDPRNKQITKIPRFFVFELINNILYYNQFILQSGDLLMDDGFLFPNSNKQTYIYDFSLITNQFDQDYAKKVYGEELLSILYFNLDQIKTVNMVEYPKISEILADAGSIISWILSISFIVSKYNENLSIEIASKEIITMYFNDFMDFKILKNWQGKIKSVKFKGKEYDPQRSEVILNRLDRIAIGKINYMNLQNEVAKLQFILQEHLGQQQIYKYLESKHKLESLFDKIGMHDSNYQNSQNQILPQNDEQFVQIQQDIQKDLPNQKDTTIEQELEERMGILDLKLSRNLNINRQYFESNSFQITNNHIAQQQI